MLKALVNLDPHLMSTILPSDKVKLIESAHQNIRQQTTNNLNNTQQKIEEGVCCWACWLLVGIIPKDSEAEFLRPAGKLACAMLESSHANADFISKLMSKYKKELQENFLEILSMVLPLTAHYTEEHVKLEMEIVDRKDVPLQAVQIPILKRAIELQDFSQFVAQFWAFISPVTLTQALPGMPAAPLAYRQPGSRRKRIATLCDSIFYTYQNQDILNIYKQPLQKYTILKELFNRKISSCKTIPFQI